MNQSLKYERCKQQTEAKLLEIKDLELQICYVQKQLDQKRKSILQNRQKEDYFDKLCHHHAYYQQQLTKLLSSAEKNNQESINNRPTTPTGGKRDLAEILGTTPDVFSKKIEQIIEQQLKSKQMASERELLQIQQLLDRLPRNDSTIVSTFNRVLKRLIAEMEGLKVNDDNYITPRVNKEITSEQQTITERDKTMYQLEHRKKMNALLNKKEKLESEARTVERQLIRRVRELHSDPAVQSALVKNMRTKSGNQQVKAELQSVLSQIEDMEKKIETIQKDNSLTEMESLISDVLRKINQKQTEIHILANANEEHQKLNNNIGNKVNMTYTDGIKWV
ncbi:hypothetical protein BDF20DRAFT_534905 [Mycotypha africana]|uniref:uncharacterized protein n=1 Tax=Mycotypha africana TaxID=64632 RepID=UPI002300B2E1|nr:uncharacterized protein BDF20DRAFT_534905 [Mycotypha africana]KAI8979825.1 hypothetical protein BDF20DRAFT_534905 [Mycotypha africana]